MRKHLKSIAAAILAVVMLMSISIPAMAAEPSLEEGEFEALLQKIDENMVMETTINTEEYVDHYHKSDIYLSAGQTLTTKLEITAGRDTVAHVLRGSSISTLGQSVVFKFTNNATGNSRSFTAFADNKTHDDQYNVTIPEGFYTLTVVYVSKAGYYDVNVWFA